jgi:hypothetical protein
MKQQAKAGQKRELVTDTKTLKVSMKTYNWLSKEIKDYQDTMDIIISRLIAEVEESRKKGKK